MKIFFLTAPFKYKITLTGHETRKRKTNGEGHSIFVRAILRHLSPRALPRLAFRLPSCPVSTALVWPPIHGVNLEVLCDFVKLLLPKTNSMCAIAFLSYCKDDVEE